MKLGRFLQFFFWIKLVPCRRRKAQDNYQKNSQDEEKGHPDLDQTNDDSEPDAMGWEWDLCSVKFLLLMLASLGANAVYVFFTLATLNVEEMALFKITVLVFKLLNMTTAIFIPWLLGPAACRLGPLALQPQLIVSQREFAAFLMPILGLCLGLMCIHAHALIDHLWGIIPVMVSSCLGGLGFMGIISLFFAWMTDFRMAARAVGCRVTISVLEADAVLARFEQLKAAVGPILFLLLALAQLIQIFSIYNIFTGKITYILFLFFGFDLLPHLKGDFEWLQMILMNRLYVPDDPLEVYSFLNFLFHKDF